MADSNDNIASIAPPPRPVRLAPNIPPPPGHNRRTSTSTSTSTSTPTSTTSVADPVPVIDEAQHTTTMTIRPWVDPLVDEIGHDPRSRYVEQFWLGVLGPTATWLVRRLAAGLDQQPEGYEIDLEATARMMGMSYSPDRPSPFAKALQRCTMFGLAHQTSDGLAVRRRIPTVAHRHLRRMPDDVQHAHDTWQRTTITIDELSRAHRLAMAMLDTGDDATTVEHQLIALGIADAVAAEVADNACRL